MAPQSSNNRSATKATSEKSPRSTQKTAPVGSNPTTFGSIAKPDQTAYKEEQDALKAKIDAVNAELEGLKIKIDDVGKGGPSAERRAALREQLEELKVQHNGFKANRGKVLDQLKALQDGIQKRTKDLNSTKQKAQFKSTEDIDSHIRNLERQIEAGTLTLTAEKKAIASISDAKRWRRAVENFQNEQTTIDADKARADELRKQLDDPEAKVVSDKYDAVKAEMEELRVQGDEVYANRHKLFDERKELQSQLDDLWSQKKESSRQYREAQDRYHKKIQDERARRAERFAAQRAEAEAERREAIARRLREEAEIPAFQAQIEDSQTLINFFVSRIGGVPDAPTPTLNGARSDIAGVPKLESRKVDTTIGDGLIARKKKGEEEEIYFIGGKSKKKTGKVTQDSTTSTETKLQLPLSTLSALLSLSIPAPTSHSDISRTIEDLKTKKAWFEANQGRITAENIAKADAEIKKLENAPAVKNASPLNGNSQEVPIPSPPHVNGAPDTVSVQDVDGIPDEDKEKVIEA